MSRNKRLALQSTNQATGQPTVTFTQQPQCNFRALLLNDEDSNS